MLTFGCVLPRSPSSSFPNGDANAPVKCLEEGNGTASAIKSTTKVLKKRGEGLKIDSFIETKLGAGLDVCVSDDTRVSMSDNIYVMLWCKNENM